MDKVLDRGKTHYESVLTHVPAHNCPELCDQTNSMATDWGQTDPLSPEVGYPKVME